MYNVTIFFVLFVANSGPVQARRGPRAGDPAVDRGRPGGEVPGGEDIRGRAEGIFLEKKCGEINEARFKGILKKVLLRTDLESR